ncbi:MAG: cation diffusion facilitator family transporter [Candidatus Methanoplasma sp.]|jgi:cation diffusion facilitator family transporter|nr:cation diffusion facilitator family transporter [Candidatus Methanoplasma sp.]
MSEASNPNYEFQRIIVAVGASLMIMKFIAYFATHSMSVLTDALESIVNVVAGGIGLYALHLSAQPADRSHPFGHGKVEVISASIEGSMISVAGLIILFESFMRLLSPEEVRNIDIGLLLVLFAAAVNYALGRSAVRRGRQTRSIALESSGKHLCADTYSSIGITIGLLAVLATQKMGYQFLWLDPLVAMLFGAIIVLTGCRVVKKAVDDIMEKADRGVLDQIVRCLDDHRSEDWIDIHSLRVIKFGSKMHVEMHTTLPFDMTVEQEEIQKRKLHEAVASLYGESVELIMMPEPCKEFSCIHCSRECASRRAKFVGRMNWTIDSLSQDHQHALRNMVVIDINGDK